MYLIVCFGLGLGWVWVGLGLGNNLFIKKKIIYYVV